jgi:formamidopyrimidine-DNA glycosylase
MPELPEVETVRRGLMLSLPGEEVACVEVLRPQSIGFPKASLFEKKLPGHRFLDIERRGKYLLFNLSGDAGLACHLRMSGRLLLVDGDAPTGRFLRINIKLKSGRELRFEDMRVFGRLWYKPPGQSFGDIIPTLNELGVEPLEGLTGNNLNTLFKGKKQSIKTALLDQRTIAGVGNIYADESLFRAGIHPQTAAGSLKHPQLEKLAIEIKSVLERAIELGGSTLRDYTDSSGVNGNYQHSSQVYGRTGKPCHVCKSAIKRLRLVGRSTHFCPKCQKLKVSRTLKES